MNLLLIEKYWCFSSRPFYNISRNISKGKRVSFEINKKSVIGGTREQPDLEMALNANGPIKKNIYLKIFFQKK